MESSPKIPADYDVAAECWCCGETVGVEALTRLGLHPEVAICRNCAHDLDRRSGDRSSRPARAVFRRLGDRVRDEVMARGWHQRAHLGPLLRRINRRSPW